jgi:hypothetical protein
VTSPARARLAACLIAVGTAAGGLLVAGTAPAAAADDGSTTSSPLEVTIATMTPTAVPRSGPLTLTGQITNRSTETWTGLNVYLTTSSRPITGRAELAEAVATPEDASVAERRTGPGLYDAVGDLAPGATTSYRVSVRRTDLGIGDEPGVYWAGVHVLGATAAGGRDRVADGRARTFLPQVPPATAPTRLALVLPITAEVRRDRLGRLLNTRAWERSLSSDGRLDRLLDLSGRAVAPLTWVVDPAVLDAARSVGLGNPALDDGPTPADGAGAGDGPAGDPSTAPGTSPGPAAGSGAGSGDDGSPSGSASPDAGTGTGAGDTAGDTGTAEAVAARAWLQEVRRQAAQHTLMTLPYGDLDVAATLGSRIDDLYTSGRAAATEAMTGLGLDGSTAVVAPLSGYLPAAALRRLGPGTPVLLRDAAFPGATGPVVARPGRAPVVLADTAAGSGGPAPTPALGALALRQRLLADAALHALGPEAGRPLVVSTPPSWDPGTGWDDADFFVGLDQPWLRLVDLPSVVRDERATGAEAAGGRLSYPARDRRAQVPLANLLASQRLTRTGSTYGTLLSANDTIDSELRRIALLGSSSRARTDPEAALQRVTRTTGYVQSRMQLVRIEGPGFVMMSSETGPIQVTLVNGLDQPVRVGISAQTRSPDLRILVPDPITLGPGKRTAIRLEARSNDIDVHAVTLVPTDVNGDPLGSLTQVSVRTSRVSTVIWVVIGFGLALLFAAIAVRLFRRIRARKATHGPRLPRDPSRVPGQGLNA